MKIWLIQNGMAPYRVKLFQMISEAKDVDFKLLFLYKKWKTIRKFQWDCRPEDLPFKTEHISGFTIKKSGQEYGVCINPKLLTKMIKEKPDVVICAGFSFATFIASIYKIFFNGKYIIWSEGTYITESIRSSIFRIFIRKFLARFASGFVDAGILSKEYLETLLPQKHSKPFFRSYNCIDNKKFENNLAIYNDELDKLKTKYPAHNILFVGQLIERKGIIQILNVYKKIIKDYSEPVGLIFVGQGPMKDYIEDYKEKHNLKKIFLEGFVSNDILSAYYKFCSVFMLLSLQDPNPLVVFEALVSGIPIVCSNRAGNAIDFISDGKNGYIVDPYSADDAASKCIDTFGWKNKKDVANFSREIVKKANYKDSAQAFVDACKSALAT